MTLISIGIAFFIAAMTLMVKCFTIITAECIDLATVFKYRKDVLKLPKRPTEEDFE